MKSVKWRWWLPIVLLILTVACQIYAGHQDQVAKDRSFHHHSIFLLPPFPDRLMRFVSFPALALAAPLGHLDFAFFHYYFFHAFESWGAVLITVEDIGFFVGVFFLWYAVGATLDRRLGWRRSAPSSRTARLALLAGGLGLAVLTALHGDHLLADPYRSYRQIGAGGLFWACILFAWVVPGLWREAGGGRRGKVLLRVATGCLFLAAPLWVGGPFGLTQALGEYLRPRTVRMVQPPILVRECSPGGKLPEGLMRQTEAVAASRHLTLQRVVTCESLFANARAPRDPANSARGQTLDCDVKFLEPADNMWAKTGCATFQFRRHFVVGAMYYDGEREIAVEAAMIQSRWDYLRQNWNRRRDDWFWPYEGLDHTPRTLGSTNPDGSRPAYRPTRP